MNRTNVLTLILSLLISTLTMVLIFFISKTDIKILLIMGGVMFFISFFLILIGINKIYFHEICKIHNKIDELLEIPSSHQFKKKQGFFDDKLKNIGIHFNLFFLYKQKEIDILKKQETFRKEFVADVSHELKTPLFATQGFICTLLDGAINDENVHMRFLKKAAKNLDDLTALVQDLLTLSQIEMGNTKMKFDNIDLYHLSTGVVEQFKQQGMKQSIHVHPLPPHHLLIVQADWLRITQVMTNLLSNAIKYSDKNGCITVRFEEDDQKITTFVTDTGIGISSCYFDQIFQRFYRIDKSRSKEKGGTGLGLSIVKHILEEHNSYIEVESCVGEGSTFSFKLQKAGVL